MAIEAAGRDQSARSSLDHRAVLGGLVDAGEKLPATSRDEILALGPAAVPMLLEILGDEQLHLEDAPGHGWAPIHAVDLLGELRAPDAIEPLLRLLPKTNVDEIIHSGIIRALEAMGQGALEPALRAYAENADRDCRSALSSVLAGLGVKDERVFSILREQLALEPGLGAVLTAEYGDARAIPALMRAFDEYEIDVDSDGPLANHDLTEIKAAIEGLGGELNELQHAQYARGIRPAEEWRAKMREALGSRERSTPPAASRQKLGRNDPCNCGSGKKYKKCCLTSDEQERAAARRADESVDDVAAEFFAQKARGPGPAQQMADFAQPLIDAGKGDLASLNRAMSLGMLFWNLAICKDDQRREEMLTDVMTNAMALGQDQAEFRELADDMVERHRTMFPEMHR